MRIRNVRHKGLRRFIESDDPTGLPTTFVEKIRNIVSFLQAMQYADELVNIPSWKAHQLTGDRKGIWSLTVSRNYRITFALDVVEQEVVDLNYEDYH